MDKHDINDTVISIDQEFIAALQVRDEAPQPAKVYGNKLGAALKALSMAGGELVSKFEKNMKGFGYNYASLSQFTGTVRGVFAKYDLVVVQPLAMDNGKQVIRTLIYHTSCDEPIVESVVELAPYADLEDPIDVKTGRAKKTLHNGQKHGAAITYARKYALQSILCISPDESELDLDSPKLAVQSAPSPAPQAPQTPQAPQAPQAPVDPIRKSALDELRGIAKDNRSAIQIELKARKMTEADLGKPNTSTQAIVNVLNAVKAALEPKSTEDTSEADTYNE